MKAIAVILAFAVLVSALALFALYRLGRSPKKSDREQHLSPDAQPSRQEETEF